MFESESQRRFMWMKHPSIAKRWAHEYPGQHDLPYHKKKKKHDKEANALLSGPFAFMFKDAARAGTNAMDTAKDWANKMINSPKFRRDGNNLAIDDAYEAENRELPSKQMSKRLTVKQAFKAGFLLKCAEQNLTLEQVQEKLASCLAAKPMTKKAVNPILMKLLGGTSAFLGNSAAYLGKKVMDTGATLALAAPVVAGAGGMYLWNKTSPKPSADDVQHEELTGEYKRLASQARRKATLRQMQEDNPGSIVQLS